MDKAVQQAAAENQVGISIRNLYKIFGTTPEKHMEAVKNGMTKQELLDTQNHVLGLRNINLDIRPGEIQGTLPNVPQPSGVPPCSATSSPRIFCVRRRAA